MAAKVKRNPLTNKPRLMTKLLPRMILVEGNEWPLLYDMAIDTLFVSKKAKHIKYCIARGICQSVAHDTRLNTFEGGPVALDARHSLDQIELNVSTFMLMYYMGGVQLPTIQWVHEVIGSWIDSYAIKSGNPKPKLDWDSIIRVARFYVPPNKKEFFNRKIKYLKKAIANRHNIVGGDDIE